MANNYNYQFKYIIIGDPSVGKSNLLLKFIHNRFSQEYQSTIGVEFGVKNIEIDSRVYRIQVWDTAGQENFRSITRSYYNSSACCVLLYDITKRRTFESLSSWIDDVRNECPKTVITILVGNKCDLEKEREVSFDEGKEFAMRNRLMFIESSAKTGEGVSAIFTDTAEQIIKKIKEGYYDLSSEFCGVKKGGGKKVILDNGKLARESRASKLEEPLPISGKKKCCK